MARTVKFGKLEPKHDPRTFQLSRYESRRGFQPPPSADWSRPVRTWEMFKNDLVGCCTCAAAGHAIHGWTANETAAHVLTDRQVIDAYAKVSGWNGRVGSPTDTGAYLLDVLNFWRKRGVGDRTIAAYPEVDVDSPVEAKFALHAFGALYTGFWLPQTTGGRPIEDAARWIGKPDPYDRRTRPGAAGGHAVSILAYNSRWLKIVTWGRVVLCTWLFFRNYCDEAYAIISPDWISDDTSPSGFSRTALEADLERL